MSTNPKLTSAQLRVIDEVFLLEDKFETPVEWAENHRVMSSAESKFKGPFSYDRNPYLKEIVNLLLDSSTAHKVAVMKGAQIGFSTGVIENGIGWLIRHNPTNILLASGNDELVKDQFTKKIDKMIDSSGLRALIRSSVNKKRNTKTGDTDNEKEFPGGSLRGRGLQSAGKWRQFSVKVIFADDLEAAKKTDKREGSTVNLINQRAASFGDSAKIFYISTPATKQSSLIEPLYLQGDQRRYMVPCPCCGTFIPLEFQLRKDNQFYGVVWDVDEKGELVEGSTHYRCQSCGDKFKEDGNKANMLRHGHWMPTAKPSEPNFYSYQISALYAPPGMYNWEHYARQFILAVKSRDEGELKTFNNVVLGKTWEEKTVEPKANKISQNTRNYEIGTIPNQLSINDGNGEIVLLTCACDLNGLDTINPKYDRDDARLDYEVLAHSETGATYSIDAGSIGTFQRRKGIENRDMWSYKHHVPFSVWQEFAEIVTKNYVTDDGREMRIFSTGIDAGVYSNYVYEFIELMRGQANCYALKGDSEAKKIRTTTDDSAYFARSKSHPDLFIVRTNAIKNELSNYMQLVWPDDKPQPANFMNFPIPSSNKYTVRSYFSQYESEKKGIEQDATGVDLAYRWEKKSSSSQNHFWDCRVYNIACANIIMHLIAAEVGVKYPNWKLFCESIKN